MFQCSPHLKNTEICLDIDILKEMVINVNKNIINKIKLYPKKEMYDQEKYKKYLFDSILNAIDCDNLDCLFDHNFNLKENNLEKFEKYTFKPILHGNYSLLSNIDIENVMKQYQLKINNFLFIGCLPIDFEKLNKPNINIETIENYFKFAIVFNLDEHWQKGSHWVCLYFNIKNGLILYFDSYGIMPVNNISKYINKIKNIISNKNIKPIMLYNKIRHQYKYTECGVYCLYFLIHLLQNENDYNKILNKKISDEEVRKFRKVYFNLFL